MHSWRPQKIIDFVDNQFQKILPVPIFLCSVFSFFRLLNTKVYMLFRVRQKKH